MISFIYLFSAQSIAQSIGNDSRTDQCTVCNDPKNNIHVSGDNTFTATSAQAYFWEICDGSATIVGSNTNQNVEVSALGGTTSKIRLTRFNNGNCYEYCEEFTIPQEDPPECDTCFMTMSVDGNTSNGTCGDATVTIFGCDQTNNIQYIEWSYGLAGTTNPICTGYPYGCPLSGTTIGVTFSVPPFTIYPEGNLLQVYADVYYNDGTTMCHYYIEELLICEKTGGGGSLLNINLFPNPSKTGDQITFDGIDFKNINSIDVLDMSGNLITNTKPSKQSFEINNLTQGVYIVKFTTVTNEIIQKKLVVE